MKKALIILTSAAALLALAMAPGCSGGGDDDDDDDDGGSIATGSYAQAAASMNPNTCGGTEPFFAQFATVDVVATAVSLDLDFEGAFQTTYDITGTSLYDPSSPGELPPADFNDPAVALEASGGNFQTTFDCIVTQTVDWEGEITGTNEFTLTDRYDYAATGTECNLLATSGGFAALPCQDGENTDWAL